LEAASAANRNRDPGDPDNINGSVVNLTLEGTSSFTLAQAGQSITVADLINRLEALESAMDNHTHDFADNNIPLSVSGTSANGVVTADGTATASGTTSTSGTSLSS
jgi:hypothetical protein